jgi:hypothetical protein
MRAAILFCVIVAWGCSKKPGEAGSCRRDGDNVCVEFGAAQATAGKRMCDPAKWTNGAGSCPRENRLGSCVSPRDGARFIYGGPPNHYTAASAKTACEFAAGTFTAEHP